MPFIRPWDGSCPRIWDRWEVDGTRYVIQDLQPEDDDLAVRMMITTFINDEPLCSASDTANDTGSVRGTTKFWSQKMRQRTSLACYAEKHGGKTLAAVNCCVVYCRDEHDDTKVEGKCWQNVINALNNYMSDKVDAFKYLKVEKFEKLLYGLGLLVDRPYRNAKIGTRMLDAREPFCRFYGIKGTSTVFTGIGSQTCAARAGFTTIAEATWKELADAGLKYPRDESRSIKLMVKKYD